MKRMISLIRACMTDNMSLFKIKNKKNSKKSRILLPLVLLITVFFCIWSYANMIMEPLAEIHLEFVLLTLFVVITSLLTLIEGIYKSGNLLFNCKDDDLLFSLPIKKSTVLFIRILKFYLFELMYNSMFLIPAMVVYISYVPVNSTFYIVSVVALLLLPIIPIIISCIIGGVISNISTKFKFKNLAQIIVTTIFLLVIFYGSANLQNIVGNLAKNAESINEIISRVYYPAGAYLKMITNFEIKDLLIFISINLIIFVISIIVFGSIYFNINSKVKAVKKNSNSNKEIKIKKNKPMKALIKKEMKKFRSSPVFATNTGFGLVLFVVGCIAIALKLDKTLEILASEELTVDISIIKSIIPLIMLGFIVVTGFMTSITSSMISLEKKSINVLKSLPVKTNKILLSKILTAVIIMIPFFLVGETIVFIKFKFTFLEILSLIIFTVIISFVSETYGLLVNLKYPKMDAENDTEIVKQSMSSTVAVFTGIIFIGLTIFGIVKCFMNNISIDLTILYVLLSYLLIFIIMFAYLNKMGIKMFKGIDV